MWANIKVGQIYFILIYFMKNKSQVKNYHEETASKTAKNTTSIVIALMFNLLTAHMTAVLTTVMTAALQKIQFM